MKNKRSNQGIKLEKIKPNHSELKPSKTETFYKGRISRNEFTWNFLTLLIICVIALFNSGVFDSELLFIVIYIILIGSSSLIVKRLHDLGRPAYHFSLFLIPIYDIIFIIDLCDKKGQIGANRYGDDPLKDKY